jgi:hypothetical protein
MQHSGRKYPRNGVGSFQQKICLPCPDHLRMHCSHHHYCPLP